ncbi:ParA family protein [Eubacteriales bacterium OttesenSCG-928-M02]|nr:ParA family protein [Eubacteriales bacterium OttesenSCG-928-M02]
MAKTTAIYCQKGGVGKTTTCQLLAVALAQEGQRVLMVDLDVDPSLTDRCGFSYKKTPYEESIAHLLRLSIGKEDMLEPFPLSSFEGCNLITSCPSLRMLEDELARADAPYALRNVLDYIEINYDHILIDCRPSLSRLSAAALTAADSVIIPVLPYDESINGMLLSFENIEIIRQSINPHLKIDGVLVTMLDRREKTALDTLDELRESLPVFQTAIPRSSYVAKCSAEGYSIIEKYPRNPVSIAYGNLAKEVMEIERHQEPEDEGSEIL